MGQSHRVLSPEDRFLQLCVNGLTSERASFLWIVDAARLVAQEGLDLTLLELWIREARAELPMFVALAYLSSHLGILEQPLVRAWETSDGGDFLASLAAAAESRGRVERESLLQAGWAGERGRLRRHLGRSRGLREQLFLLRAKAVPSPAALVQAGRIRGASDLPSFHAARAWRKLSNRRSSRQRDHQP
jgi:hypothetical protein